MIEKQKSTWFKAIIILAFMLLFGFLPPFGPVTADGMRVLGIFFGCIVAWSVGEIIWPSLLALVLLGFVGENTVGGMFTAAFGNQTLHMVFFCLLLCYGIEKSGLLEVITKYILSRKFAKKGPWWLCFAFWSATAVASAVTVATLAICLLCWSLFYDIAKQLNMDKKSPYVSIVLIGIPVSAYLGGCVMPYNAFTQICFGVLKSVAPEMQISFGAYVLTMAILTAIALIVLPPFFKYIVRVKVDYNPTADMLSGQAIKMNTKQKIVLGYIILLCAMLILPYYLPKTWFLTQALNNLGFVGSFVLIIIAMQLTIRKDGENLMDIGEAMLKGIPYHLLFLVATALAVSGQLTSPTTGISALISSVLTPIVTGKSTFMLMFLLVVFGLVLTNVINNIVCITLMVPVGLTFLANGAGNPAVLVALFCMALYQGIVTPAGSMFGAMLHGNTEWLRGVDVYKYGTLIEIILALIIGFIGVPLGSFLFSIM